MNARLAITALVTIAVIAFAWKVTEDKAPQTEVSRAPLFPALAARVNDVTRMTLTSADRETRLVRADDGWVVENLDGFPARFTDVKRTLLQVAALEIVEAKTARPESYARIGVADVDTEGADGTLIELAAAGETTIAALVAGNTRAAGTRTQRYVRRAGEAQSWLVEGELDAPADPIPWVDAEIADIDAERVRQVEVRPADGDPVVVSKSDPSENYFGLQGVPDGYEPKSRTTVSSLGAALINLRFNHVASANRVADLEPRTRIAIETFDGIRAEIDLFDTNERTLARFAFTHDPERAVDAADDDAATDGSEGDSAEADGAAEDAAPDPATEAAMLAARTGPWVYELPDYKMRMIDKRLQDLIEPQSADEDGAATE